MNILLKKKYFTPSMEISFFIEQDVLYSSKLAYKTTLDRETLYRDIFD